MADRDFILPPPSKMTYAEVVVNPYLEAMNIVFLMNSIEKYSGLPQRLVTVIDSISDDLRERNELIVEGFWNLLHPKHVYPDFPSYLNALREKDAVTLRNKAVHGLCEMVTHKVQKYKGTEAVQQMTPLSPDDLMDNEQAYIDYIQQYTVLVGGDEQDVNIDHLKELHGLFNDPEAFKATLVTHLQRLWDEVLEGAIEQSRSLVKECVAAFQQVNLQEMDTLEMAKAVTGRDLNDTYFTEMLSKAHTVYFVPSGYMGPYVSAFELANGDAVVIFGTRLPDGSLSSASPELTRSELLVRLNALADDTRLRILEVLSEGEELCAQDFITRLDLSQSAASRHLRQLSATGYLSERTRQGAKCYSLNTDRVMDTLNALQSFLAID